MAGLLQREMLPYQLEMIYSKSRFPCLCAGYGSGKSETLVMKVLKQLFETDNAVVAIYEPTVDLIKRIMYPRFEEILANAGLMYKLNKSEGTLSIPNVGMVLFRSLENPSRIIGYESHHSHIDELDTLPEDKAQEAWQKILGRNRKRINTGAKNTISVYTTPEGYRFTYKRWEKDRKKHIETNGFSDYELIKGSTYQNFYLPKEYIENLENSYPSNLIKAYLNGEFVNLESGQVYVDFDPTLNDTKEELYNDNETVHIGLDFNVNHMSAVVCVNRNGAAYIVDEIADMRDTPSMILEIQKRYDGRLIIVYPDASGNSRKTVDASKSDIGLLKDAGFRVSAPTKNPPVRDRIVSVNAMFCNAQNVRRLFVNTDKCPTLTSNLNEQAYDENGNPRKANNVDHNLDALGYVIHRQYGISRAKASVTRMKF